MGCYQSGSNQAKKTKYLKQWESDTGNWFCKWSLIWEIKVTRELSSSVELYQPEVGDKDGDCGQGPGPKSLGERWNHHDGEVPAFWLPVPDEFIHSAIPAEIWGQSHQMIPPSSYSSHSQTCESLQLRSQTLWDRELIQVHTNTMFIMLWYLVCGWFVMWHQVTRTPEF